MALVCELVSRDAEDASVDDIFREVQAIAAQSDHLLVDENCQRAEPLPTSIVTLPSDTEPAAAALVPYRGHRASEPQEQASLFGWAELLADAPGPAKPRGRNSRPTGPSLFEWVLEREREASLATEAG